MIKELVIIKAIGKTLDRLPDDDARLRVINYVRSVLIGRATDNYVRDTLARTTDDVDNE